MKNQAKVTVPEILSRKSTGDKIVALTAYDFTMARLFDQAGVDIILVGDTLGCIVQGLENTLSVTLEQMIYHTQCVSKACKTALVVADLPFMSYQVSPEQALISAGRLIKEGGASAVKLEGGIGMAETIKRIVSVDIPVMGHIGLTPQSFHRMGGHKVQGKSSKGVAVAGSRERVLEDAKAVNEAGAFSFVIEGVPVELAKEITSEVSVPTIGIGAGSYCDGQILVFADMLGLNGEFRPKFVKRYLSLEDDIMNAVRRYSAEVKDGEFPAAEHSHSMIGVAAQCSGNIALAKS